VLVVKAQRDKKMKKFNYRRFGLELQVRTGGQGVQ